MTRIPAPIPTPRPGSLARRGRRGAWLLLIGSLGAAGCSGGGRIDVPSALPNVTQHEFLTLRWALVRQSGSTRAVGLAESSSRQWDATVELQGLDGAGGTVSRGSTVVRPGFSPSAVPFQATLVETGREAEFRLQVVQAQQYTRPSR